ncbi:hypothetical protein CDV31_017101 [Fusarium ambrosium]|uniref:Uncharacterized protein n=1 Tax=Fusarium ambrosium TaxID=131363 RepID=A0A428RT28_9HYPO|nr:hypothetical protein CDV31_017101 [Fusarium ambrosium]
MDLEAELKPVETLFSSLENDATLTASQRRNLKNNIALIEETKVDSNKHSQAARSRRKAARILLCTIHEHLGDTILFLCSVAIPITKLNDINREASIFVSKLQNWSTTMKTNDSIRSLIRSHFTPSVLSKLSVPQPTQAKRVAHFDTSPARRLRTDSSMPKHQAIPSLHGVLDLAASHRPTETPIDDDGDDSEGDDGDGSEASDESDPGGPWATDNPRSTLGDDVQLYSNVYELEGMDAIRVIATQRDIACRLTMPHHTDSTPFITIQCPRTLAMQFLTRRKQINW